MQNIELVTYNRLFFDKSKDWLNDSEVNYLTDTGTLPSDREREQWFSNLPFMKDYKIFGVLYGGDPVGVCGLKHITSSQAEYFGYIGQKNLWGGGIGNSMMSMIEFGARLLKIKTLNLRVIKDNPRAVHLYRKRHFEIIEQDNKYFYMSKDIG